MRRSTTGVKLLVLCKDGSEQWISLKNLKEPNLVECVEYAKARKIDTKPAFCLRAPYTLKKKERIINAVRSRLKATLHKYGLKVPRDLAHAEQLDQENGNTPGRILMIKRSSMYQLLLKYLRMVKWH